MRSAVDAASIRTNNGCFFFCTKVLTRGAKPSGPERLTGKRNLESNGKKAAKETDTEEHRRIIITQ